MGHLAHAVYDAFDLGRGDRGFVRGGRSHSRCRMRLPCDMAADFCLPHITHPTELTEK